MKKKLMVRRAIAAACLAAFAASGAALAQDEVESNFPITSAQPLQFDSSGVAVVNGFLSDGDADIYSFPAKADDKVTVDIDGGAKNGGPGHIDTYVTLLAPESDGYTVLDGSDDGPMDEGSNGTEDSYISAKAILKDGVYYIAVAGYPNQVVDGGVFRGSTGNLTGSYTLIVSGVSQVVNNPPPSDPVPEPEPEPEPVPSPFPQEPVEVQAVSIDIKPGLKRIARIDPKSRRDIPVALLGSRNFDVRKVDVTTLTFGRTGEEQSLKRCVERPMRINRDRRPDLLCFFENQQAGFEATDERGVLKGATVDGKPFEGSSMLKVISEKRKHRYDRDDRRGHRHDDRWDRRDRR